jgi:hypothetical protein
MIMVSKVNQTQLEIKITLHLVKKILYIKELQIVNTSILVVLITLKFNRKI